MRVLLRGIRTLSDFEYEFQIALANKKMAPELETFFMMTGQNLYFVSSTMIKELFHYGGDVTPYVPEAVIQRLRAKIPLKVRKP